MIKHSVMLLAGEPRDADVQMISDLNALLKKMGSEIAFDQIQIDGSGKAYNALRIDFDAAAAAEYLSRGAGRKQVEPTLPPETTVADVRRMLDIKSAAEVAADLGISRSTLFRRLKKPDEYFF